MAHWIEDDRTVGYYYVTINADPRKGPFVIYREGVGIGVRPTLEIAIQSVLRSIEWFGAWVAPWEGQYYE